jgi:ParB/RepB/Spo0J family partition protein
VTAAVPTRSSRNGKPSDAVVGEAFAEPGFGMVVSIPLASIDIGDNVRVNIEAIDELATSIAEHGVLQPIKVRPHGERFEVVWGQRRVLASRKAGLERIPALITTTDQAIADRSIEQLIENLHRADLNPIDRAQAMKAVVASGVSQADLARSLGLAPSTVANDLGILDAPAKVRTLIEQGAITPSHAKAMKGLAPSTQAEVAERAAREGWSAHRTEEEVQRQKRVAEQEAQRRREDADRVKNDLERLQAEITALAAAKKPGLETEIVVFQDYYGQGDVKITALAAALQKAGFTNVRIASRHGDVEPRPSGGLCNCIAWKATLHSTYAFSSGGYTTKLQATPACIVPAHRQAKATADRKAEVAKHALQDQVQARVKAAASGWAIPGAGAIAVDRILAEAALWGLLAYRLPEWSVARGGKRNTAWAVLHALSDEDLAKELAKEIANDFRDKAGYHVDWTGLALELGVEAPA